MSSCKFTGIPPPGMAADIKVHYILLLHRTDVTQPEQLSAVAILGFFTVGLYYVVALSLASFYRSYVHGGFFVFGRPASSVPKTGSAVSRTRGFSLTEDGILELPDISLQSFPGVSQRSRRVSTLSYAYVNQISILFPGSLSSLFDDLYRPHTISISAWP